MEFEPLDQFLQRRKKLSEIESLGHAPYPHKFEYTHTPRQVAEQYARRTAEELTADHASVRLAGRIVALHTHPFNKKYVNVVGAKLQGVGTYDVAKKEMISLLWVFEGGSRLVKNEK